MDNKPSIGLKRNTIDKYYTKPSAVDLCMNLIKEHLICNKDDWIIEPSAGNGAFIESIKLLTEKYKFYDLSPEHGDILKQDYLEFDATVLLQDYCKLGTQQIHVIGNPPFGRQSSLAIKFIKKSCEFCTSISFILPKSFKKDSLKKSFPLNYHLVCEEEIPKNSFLVNGVEHDVPCVFQIWQIKHFDRTVADKLEPTNFKFVLQNDHPDISFRRVGVNAGTIDTTTDCKSVQSHYFIRFTDRQHVNRNVEKLKKIIYETNNTVGPKSISKQELIKEFNKVM